MKKQFPQFTVEQLQHFKDYCNSYLNEYDEEQEITEEWCKPWVEVFGYDPDEMQIAAFTLWYYGREEMKQKCQEVLARNIEHINSVHPFDQMRAL